MQKSRSRSQSRDPWQFFGKSRHRHRKIWSRKKSLGIGIRKFGLGNKVSVSVSGPYLEGANPKLVPHLVVRCYGAAYFCLPTPVNCYWNTWFSRPDVHLYRMERCTTIADQCHGFAPAIAKLPYCLYGACLLVLTCNPGYQAGGTTQVTQMTSAILIQLQTASWSLLLSC